VAVKEGIVTPVVADENARKLELAEGDERMLGVTSADEETPAVGSMSHLRSLVTIQVGVSRTSAGSPDLSSLTLFRGAFVKSSKSWCSSAMQRPAKAETARRS